MDAQTCLKKLQCVGVLNFSTVGLDGTPQARCISAIHYTSDALYFFTARGKEFCRELLHDGQVQILAYTRYKEPFLYQKRNKNAVSTLFFRNSLIFPMCIRAPRGKSESSLLSGICGSSISIWV